VSFIDKGYLDENREIEHDLWLRTTWKVKKNSSQLLVTKFKMFLSDTEELDEFQDLEKNEISIKEIFNELERIKNILYFFVFVLIMSICFTIFNK